MSYNLYCKSIHFVIRQVFIISAYTKCNAFDIYICMLVCVCSKGPLFWEIKYLSFRCLSMSYTFSLDKYGCSMLQSHTLTIDLGHTSIFAFAFIFREQGGERNRGRTHHKCCQRQCISCKSKYFFSLYL